MVKRMQPTKSDSRKFVAVDPSKCTGCGICEYVCTLEKSELLRNPLRSRIRIIHLAPLLNAAMTCRFCKDAPCIRACPEKALTQSETSGVIIVDERKCNACDWCIQACPYGGIALHPDKRIVVACDLCGGEPKCVEFCPEEALELVSDDKAAEKTWSAAIERIPSEIERLNNVVKKKQWTSVLAEAEQRAKRTAEKLEAIDRRERSCK
jgi:Fe-S-cluster-containing hydrogenase component 2